MANINKDKEKERKVLCFSSVPGSMLPLRHYMHQQFISYLSQVRTLRQSKTKYFSPLIPFKPLPTSHPSIEYSSCVSKSEQNSVP